MGKIHALLLSVLLVWSGLAFGEDHAEEYEQQSGKLEFAKPASIKIDSDRVLIVTHACSVWDEKCTTKSANDITIKWAKENKIPVIYLQDDFDQKTYFCEDRKPNFFAKSNLGEFSFAVKPTQVLTTGGYSSYCQRETMRDLLKRWSARQESADVCQVTTAIYEYTYSELLPSDIRTKASDVLIKKHGVSTVPFSDVLDLFDSDESRIAYLKTRVEDYINGNKYKNDKVMTDFRIVVKYRGKEVVVQEGKGNPPFNLTYRFVHPKPGEPADLTECSTK